MKSCTRLWREAHFEVKMHKAHQSTTTSDHFWKLRCSKSARGCGAKRISRSKVQNTDGHGAFLEVQMSFRVGRRKGLRTLPKASKT